MSENTEGQERIVAAAIQYDGLVISMAAPARHHNILETLDRAGMLKLHTPREQGFLTSLGRYLNRESACVVARVAGQLEHRTKTGPEHALYSEDLW